MSSDTFKIEKLLASGADPAYALKFALELQKVDDMGIPFCPYDYVKVLPILVKACPIKNLKGSHGATALHKVLEWGREQKQDVENCVRELIALKENVNMVDNYGFAPLHLAAFSHQSKIVALLLEAKADPNARTSVKIGFGFIRCKGIRSESVLEAALDGTFSRNIEPNDATTIQLLIESGANIESSFYMLCHSLFDNNEAAEIIVPLLLEAGILLSEFFPHDPILNRDTLAYRWDSLPAWHTLLFNHYKELLQKPKVKSLKDMVAKRVCEDPDLSKSEVLLPLEVSSYLQSTPKREIKWMADANNLQKFFATEKFQSLLSDEEIDEVERIKLGIDRP